MIFCVTLELFSLSFVPLLAPNPGDATEAVPACSYRSLSVFRCLLFASVVLIHFSLIYSKSGNAVNNNKHI